MSIALPPLALYIHLPWCVRKCPYCDFNSHRQPDDFPEQAYIKALLRDAAQDAAFAYGRPIESIFFGGGTPSLFSAQALSTLLTTLKKQWRFADDIEITLEANPGTVEHDTFQSYFDIGINRISLGVQSFNPTHLSKLGRIHSGDEAQHAIAQIQRAGFQTFNVDLMHGLPDQTPKQALQDVETAIALGAPHVSWYQLTIEPNTAFAHQPPSLPSDDTLGDIEQEGFQRFQQNGFERYEISAFAKPGHACRHNMTYWQFGDYLGIGAGAHSKLTHPDGRIVRAWKERHPKRYLATTHYVREQQTLISEELPLEFMMNALRLSGGVPWSLFAAHTGLPLSVIQKAKQQAIEKGLLNDDAEQCQLTPFGQRFLNDVLLLFSIQ